MIYIVHKDGKGFTAAVSKREADAFSEMHGGIPKSHWFFYAPDHNPFITLEGGVYHYHGESMNLETEE